MTRETSIEVNDPSRYIPKIIIGGLAFMIILGCILGLFYQVSAGERGILLTFGNPDMVAKSEGLHFKMPFVQSVVIMDIKTQKYQVDLAAASKDLQDVKTSIAINYHLVAADVPKLYKEIGRDYQDKVIYPLEQEVNKASTAQFTAEELITKREQVRQIMLDTLSAKLLPRGIIVEEISIVNFEFSPSFTQAIEAKVTAEQNALREKNRLEQVRFEREQRIAQAQGEAEAIKIQAEAIRSQGGKEYVQLQFINAWDGKMPQFLVSGGTGSNGVLPILNIDPTALIQTQ